MPLLDIPPELFENVVHKLVAVAGINGTWKLRGVCRAFQTAITYDVFAKQPLKAFTHSEERILLEKEGLYIYYRSRVPPDAHPYLSNTVNDMVDYLARELDDITHNRKKALRQSLCDALHQALPFYEILTVLRSGECHITEKLISNPPSVCVDKLVATLCLGHDHLIPTLVQELPSLKPHAFFGAPFQFATKVGHEASVRAMLKGISSALGNEDTEFCARRAVMQAMCWNSIGRRLPSGDSRVTGSPAIMTAIDRNNENLLRILLDWCKSDGFAFYADDCSRFLQAAIARSSLAIVQAVCKMPCAISRSTMNFNWPDYQKAYEHNRGDVV